MAGGKLQLSPAFHLIFVWGDLKERRQAGADDLFFVIKSYSNCYNFGTEFVKKKYIFRYKFSKNACMVLEMFILLQSFL